MCYVPTGKVRIPVVLHFASSWCCWSFVILEILVRCVMVPHRGTRTPTPQDLLAFLLPTHFSPARQSFLLFLPCSRPLARISHSLEISITDLFSSFRPQHKCHLFEDFYSPLMVASALFIPLTLFMFFGAVSPIG